MRGVREMSKRRTSFSLADSLVAGPNLVHKRLEKTKGSFPGTPVSRGRCAYNLSKSFPNSGLPFISPWE